MGLGKGSGGGATGGSLRLPAVAGSWYPGEPAALARELDAYLQAAAVTVPGRLIALVAPHAGLRYSGPVAAYAYSLLGGRRSLLSVLVGPSHRAAFPGVAVQARGTWRTPLGDVSIDEDVARALLDAGAGLVVDDPDAHRLEHSLEMQLPFLQRQVPELRIVPLLMGMQSRRTILGLARALGEALGGRDLVLVASSDLSHYEPAEVANALDAQVVGTVQSFDEEALLERLEAHDNVACGGGPVVAVMKAARALGADHAAALRYADSGDVGGRDKTRVVGYLAAAFTRRAA